MISREAGTSGHIIKISSLVRKNIEDFMPYGDIEEKQRQ